MKPFINLLFIVHSTNLKGGSAKARGNKAVNYAFCYRNHFCSVPCLKDHTECKYTVQVIPYLNCFQRQILEHIYIK